MAATFPAASVSCRYCLEDTSYLVEPKELLCSHVFCKPCLTRDLTSNDGVKCPVCGSETFESVDDLPSAATRRGDNNTHCCDVCAKKGVRNKQADVYCSSCDEKYCSKHQEVHDDFHCDHTTMDIDVYLKQARKLRIRFCTQHNDQVYSLGCKTCLNLFCADCVSAAGRCSNGRSHDLMSIGQLVTELKHIIEPLKKQATEKEGQLSYIVTEAVGMSTKWDTDTADIIAVLRKARDDQLEAIKTRYMKLEEEVSSIREISKLELSEFVDREDSTLCDLQNQLSKLLTPQGDRHQVDVITQCKVVRRRIKQIVSQTLPSLLLKNQSKLSNTAKNRNIELELIESDDIVVGDVHTLVLKPTMEVKVSGQCAAVCQYEDCTYVGMHGGNIDRIVKNGVRTKGFIKLTSHVTSIQAHRDTLYSLMAGNPCVVYVHDLSGQLITAWNHPDTASWGNKIALVSEQLVVADRKGKRLTVYTPFGQALRHVELPQISSGFLSICAAGRDCVILSDYATSRVCKVDMNSGDVLWMSTEVSGPLGVVCYGSSYALVTKQDNLTSIWVLDLQTGQRVDQLRDSKARAYLSHVYDLHVNGDVLVIPRHNENTVLFYKLR